MVVVIAVLVIAALWFFNNKKPISNNVETVEAEITPSHVATQERQALNEQTQESDTTEILDDDFSEFEQQVLKSQVQNVANQYADTARFPVGSQPVRNVNDVRQPEPFEETEVETPFDTDSGETIGVSAAVDKFQYFSNETINVRLELTNLPDGAFVKANAIVASAQGDTPLETQLDAINDSQSVLIGAFDTSVVPAQSLSSEMFVKVFIEVGGEPFLTTVAFNYAIAAAQLQGIGVAQPNGATLDIPLEFTVFQNGYYFVSALLSDQETGKPLIALQTEGRMSQGNGQLIAQAHIQALKEAGSEGPYTITNMRAYRGAEQGEQLDVPVSIFSNRFELEGFAFTQYEDEIYQDPLAQQRVDFLKELGSFDNQNTQEQGGETN